MNLRSIALVLGVLAFPVSISAQTPDLAAIARASGTPDIPGLKMVWLAPWGELAKAHPWRNIIVHQTEGPAGSARGGAQAQSKNPTRRGVMVWVETDGTVYWAVAEHLVPTAGDDGAGMGGVGRACLAEHSRSTFAVVARLDRAIQYSRGRSFLRRVSQPPRRTGSPAFAEDDSGVGETASCKTKAQKQKAGVA